MNETSQDEARSRCLVRMWGLLVALRRRPHTLRELAEQLGVHQRTIRRDLKALARLFPIGSRFDGTARRGIPGQEPNVWCLGEIPEWPRREAFPVATLASRKAS